VVFWDLALLLAIQSISWMFMPELVLNSKLMGVILCTEVCKVIKPTLDYKEIKSVLT